jgi:hypothetical protein
LKTLHKQKGFALMAGMLIFITVLSVVTIQYSQYLSKKRILNNTESFFNRVVYLRSQIPAYANTRYLQGSPINGPTIFPRRLTDLVGDYVPACSTTNNNKGLCMKVNQTPWGNIGTRDYRVIRVRPQNGASYYRAELDLKLPAKNDPALKYERNVTLSLLAQLPNIVYNDARNLITVRIDRPDKAFSYESLVKRSGDDSTLLGDWDIGGQHSITNARDYTIKNSDGTQSLVSRGLSSVITVKHNSKITKPSCPQNMQPRLNLAVSSVDFDVSKYTYSGKIQTRLIEEKNKFWVVGLDYLVWNKKRKGVIQHSGTITATISCKR